MTPHRVTHVQRTGLVAPSQWEGATDAGEFVYARYRYGTLSVDVAPSEDDWNHNWEHNDYTVFTESFGDPLDGVLSYEQLKQHTAGCIEWPSSDGDDGSALRNLELQDWHQYLIDEAVIEP